MRKVFGFLASLETVNWMPWIHTAFSFGLLLIPIMTIKVGAREVCCQYPSQFLFYARYLFGIDLAPTTVTTQHAYLVVCIFWIVLRSVLQVGLSIWQCVSIALLYGHLGMIDIITFESSAGTGLNGSVCVLWSFYFSDLLPSSTCCGVFSRIVLCLC